MVKSRKDMLEYVASTNDSLLVYCLLKCVGITKKTLREVSITNSDQVLVD
jgi:hypothetical protein